MKKILIGSLLLAVLLPLFSQIKRPAGKEENFRLVNSDKLFLSRAKEEQILELNGRVNFFYGNIEFKCDRAMIFDTQKIARLFGSVRVSADTLSITSDSLVYYRIPEVMNAGGSVVITEKKPDGSLRWFKSDYGTYNRKTEQITVWDKVRSFDLAENAWGESNYGFWDRKDGYAYLTGEPRLQTGKTDTLFIKAEKMEFFHKERKLIATFNVEVRTRDYTTTSDFLIYFLKEDKAVFTGKPVFKSDFATANAEEFYLYLSERKLTSAELKDSCQVYFAEEKNAPQTNWVKADFVKISFENDIIRRFIGEAQVSYFYLQPKGEEKDYLENEATGEYFEAIFKPDSKLDSIKMKQNILGKYKFHNNS